nr:MAG TPA: hypothetical protein [Herelleviridae sp.]
MAKKKPQTPLVSSMSTVLRKSIQSSTQVVTPEQIKEKKLDWLGVVNDSLNLFKKNLIDGKVDMSSSLDLERLVKLGLLLSGEAETITGKPNSEQEVTAVDSVQAAAANMSKIDEILDSNDPDVQSLFKKLYEGYNKKNDQE